MNADLVLKAASSSFKQCQDIMKINTLRFDISSALRYPNGKLSNILGSLPLNWLSHFDKLILLTIYI